ncbi:MAG TPA: CPBP family intramembrane glutamic endopeptidase [Bryobacteraceae bacterium]|nr:CPBP family intramembrane glutamic endopeptidase [Bryobacteraceae bacterium]
MVCAALIAAVIGKRFLTLDMLHHTLNDFLWSCLHQLALQSMVYLPLREVWPRAPAALLTGLCFAAVHVPNPVLLPGTFVWGAVAALLFERRRSIWALGIAQALLSALTPVSLNRGFHVGPFY